MTRFSHWLHKHTLLSALLLGCLVLRAFVPAGYMVGTDTGGTLSLKMCSGITLAAPAGSSGDHDTSTDDDGPAGAHTACPAGVPLLALAHVLAVVIATDAIHTALPPLTEHTRSSIPPSPTRLPRGPPAFHA